MHDQFDVTLEDGDLLSEVELTTTLIIAASESEEHLPALAGHHGTGSAHVAGLHGSSLTPHADREESLPHRDVPSAGTRGSSRRWSWRRPTRPASPGRTGTGYDASWAPASALGTSAGVMQEELGVSPA